MMTLYDLTKKYGEGRGEKSMWDTIRVVSDAVDSGMEDGVKNALYRKVYSAISGKHYNEDYAHEDVSRMFYLDADKKKHEAPYWVEDSVQDIYEDVRNTIPEYNFWDFFVTMNMVASDNMCILKRWFPNLGPEELNKKIAEMSVGWLNDEDWPTKTKIWDYLSAR